MQKSRIVVALFSTFLILCTPLVAAPIPSRAVASADRETIHQAMDQHSVTARLSQMGFSPAEVHARLDRLSDTDIHQLATNIRQLQAAGGTRERLWIAIGMVVLAAGVIAATQSDDPSY